MKKVSLACTLSIALALCACGNNNNGTNNNTTDTKTDTNTKSDTDTKTDTDAKSDTDTKTDTDAKSDADTKTDTDAKSDTDTDTDTDNNACTHDEVGSRKCQGEHDYIICKLNTGDGPEYIWQKHSTGCGEKLCVNHIDEDGWPTVSCDDNTNMDNACTKNEVGSKKCQGEHDYIICKLNTGDGPEYIWQKHSTGCGEKSCVDHIDNDGLPTVECQGSTEDLGADLAIGDSCNPRYFRSRCTNGMAVNCAGADFESDFPGELGIVVGIQCANNCETYKAKNEETVARCGNLCNSSPLFEKRYEITTEFYVTDPDGCSTISHTVVCDPSDSTNNKDYYQSNIPDRNTECPGMKEDCESKNQAAVCNKLAEQCKGSSARNLCDLLTKYCQNDNNNLFETICSKGSYDALCQQESADCTELKELCSHIDETKICATNANYILPTNGKQN